MIKKTKCTPLSDAAGVYPKKKHVFTKDQRKSYNRLLKALLDQKSITRKDYEILKAISYLSGDRSLAAHVTMPECTGEYAHYKFIITI